MSHPCFQKNLTSTAWLLGAIAALLSCGLLAQNVPPSPEDSNPYRTVKGQKLKEALEGMERAETEVRGDHRGKVLTPQQSAVLYREPGRFQSVMAVLGAARNMLPEDATKLPVMIGVERAVMLAVYTQKAEALAVLRELAWSDIKPVRDVVARSDAYADVQPMPVELMLDVLRSTASRLVVGVGNDVERKLAMQEFEDRLSKFCRNVPMGEWGEVKLIAEKALQNMAGSSEYSYYEKSFEVLTSSQPRGREAGDWRGGHAAGVGQRDNMMWGYVLVGAIMLAVAIGLWLLIRDRKSV